ncbi:MAG: hypothetical protein ACJ76D_04710 [Solirubrobacterales bacterium]
MSSAVCGIRTDLAGAEPVHPHLESAALDGSNTPSGEFARACGVAIDGKGDVYVANNGKGVIDVFDSAGQYLTSIANSDGPCGLAVDPKGNLYVVATATMNVVKYSPSSYPPTASTVYGAPVTFDSSGKASAVAVNPSNESVYVATPTAVTNYKPDGTLATVNEAQRVLIEATGGTYRLSFKGQQTASLPFNASAAEVQAALEGLSTIGAGNVMVSAGLVTFTGALGGKDVESLVADSSNLTGGAARATISESVKGFSGHIGEGTLTKAFGVDVWGANGYVYVGDESGKVYVFDAKGAKVRAEIDGSIAAGGAGSPGSFGTLPQVNVAVDQANGHVFVSDVVEGGAVYEFEARGSYLSRLPGPFANANPSDIAVDPSEAVTQGRIYVTTGSGAESQVEAFGPLPVPSHRALPSLPKAFNSACGVAIDSHGDAYVTSSGSSSIDVFKPEGGSWKLLTTIFDSGKPCGVAVDSAGNVFVSHPTAPTVAEENVLRYSPNAFPPTKDTTYGAPKIIDAAPDAFNGPKGVAINPANQHLLVAHRSVVFEYDSASSACSSCLLRNDLGAGLGVDEIFGVGVYGKSGDIYVTSNAPATRGVVVFNPVPGEVLTLINGSNAVSHKPDGSLSGIAGSQIAVDQANGHVFFSPSGTARDVYEFEAAGAYVSRFGRTVNNTGFSGVAVDNSGGPNDRDIFVTGGISGPPTVDVYRPAAYGEPPAVVTGSVSGATGTEATLEGTVDPRDFAVETCRFEYVDAGSFESSGFTAATSVACAETPAEIGSGSEPLPVHAEISGLVSSGRYYYRLAAGNKFGTAFGEPKLFGPLVVTPKAAFPVLYTEATLRALIDPAGQRTDFHFEYGESEAYGQSTPGGEIAGDEGPVEVEANLFGLSPERVYHFRIVASNSISAFVGPDQIFTTPAREASPECANAQLRSGASARLPDCRAYELVTPDLNGLRPASQIGTNGLTGSFDTWLASPGGESFIFDTQGSIPGVDGNGVADQYQAQREPAGWFSSLVAPSGAQAQIPYPGGLSADHRYSFWKVGNRSGSLESRSPNATFLRSPTGAYEPVGQGSLGEDPGATGRWISKGAEHVIFSTGGSNSPPAVPLESNAPAAGVAAIYDRTPDGVTHVVSLLPGGGTPTTDSEFLGVSSDGSTVIFEVEGKLYERRDNAITLEMAPGGGVFAGASDDGRRVFYLHGGNIFGFDAASGQFQVTSGGGATPINVSADGSHVYFVSPEQLDGSAGAAGSNNLYVWDGNSATFITILSADDLKDPESAIVTLAAWTKALGPRPGAFSGLGAVPARSTPDGSVFVFQSYANLTSYDSAGHSEIYRYDTGSPSLLCVSCDPSGDPPAGEAELEQVNEGLNPAQDNLGISPVNATSHIPNVTEDGRTVFFQTVDSLLPADGDNFSDVYEWSGGRLSLISSGNSTSNDYLYGMGADGRDVFFETNDSLVPQDQDGGNPSVYDARQGGGFAAAASSPCLDDACQGPPAAAPGIPAPASSSLEGPGNVPPKGKRPHCPKGKRLIRRHGHRVCVKRAKHRKAKQPQHKSHPRHQGGGK